MNTNEAAVNVKHAAIERIRNMPDDVSAADLVEQLELCLLIDQRIREADAGDVISNEEHKARMARWLS